MSQENPLKITIPNINGTQIQVERPADNYIGFNADAQFFINRGIDYISSTFLTTLKEVLNEYDATKVEKILAKAPIFSAFFGANYLLNLGQIREQNGDAAAHEYVAAAATTTASTLLGLGVDLGVTAALTLFNVPVATAAAFGFGLAYFAGALYDGFTYNGVTGSQAVANWASNAVDDFLSDPSTNSSSVNVSQATSAALDGAGATSDDYNYHSVEDFFPSIFGSEIWEDEAGLFDIDGFSNSVSANNYIKDRIINDGTSNLFLSKPTDTITLLTPDQALQIKNGKISADSPVFVNYAPFVAGVPNPLLIEDYASPNSTILQKGTNPDGSQFLIEQRGYGEYVIKTGMPNGSGGLSNLVQKEFYGSKDGSSVVSKTYTQFDAAGNPIGNPTINVTFPNATITGEQIGGVFGSVLAKELANGNIFAQITLDTVFETTFQTLGQSLDIYGYGKGLQGISNSPLSLEKAFDVAVNDLGDVALKNLKGAGIGAVASLLTVELLDKLGLDSLPSGVVSSIANTSFTTVFNNITDGNALTAWDHNLTDLKGLQTLSKGVGAFLGSYLATEIHAPETQIGQIGSAIGNGIGITIASNIFGQLGAAAGSIIPVIGTAIGAFIGTLVGGLIGDLFGDQDTPRAGGIVGFDPVSQKFFVSSVWALDRGSEETAHNLAQSASDSFTVILQAVHGTLLNPEVVRGGSYGHSEDKLVYWLNGGTGDYLNFDTAESLISYGVMNGLKDVKISGGDILAKRAFYSTLDQVNVQVTDGSGVVTNNNLRASLNPNITPPDTTLPSPPAGSEISISGALNAMLGNLAIAAEYKQYLQNAAVINSIIAANPNSAFAISWLITIAQASQLGLDQRHAEDWYGGWQAYLKDNKLNLMDVGFSLQQHDRIVSGIDTTTGQNVLLHDTINVYAKETFNAGTSNSTIHISGKHIQVLDGFTSANTVQGDDVAIAPYIVGGAGNDTIIAGDQGADVVGGDGNDVIAGGLLDDWLFGGNGDDIIGAGDGDGNYLSGDNGNDILVGGKGSDWLVGGTGDDKINAIAGDDIIVGGTGKDTLDGGEGADTYVYANGDGIDNIKDSGLTGVDVLRLKDINNGGFSVYKTSSDDDLVITFGTATNYNWVILDEAAFDKFQTIESILTANGVSVSLASLQSTTNKASLLGATTTGTSANENIVGTIYDDTINGVAGTDTLSGAYGSDTYRYTASSTSNVTINEDGFSFDIDRVILDSTITPAMMTVSRGSASNGEIVLNFGATKGTLRVMNVDKGAAKTIEEIRFADNSSLTPVDLMNRYFASVSTIGNDTIVGFDTNDVIKGLDGNDTITGGKGDDILSGGNGNDTYIYNVGDGNDLIYDGINGVDKILFGSGITTSEIRVTRDNTNTHDALITFANHTGSIRITNIDVFGIENFQFADGTIWTLSQLEQDYLSKQSTAGKDTLFGSINNDSITGLAGNDVIKGLEGDDTLTGGLGDDILSGGDGSDTYVYNAGDGNDLIYDGINGVDKILFGSGITTSEIRVTRDNTNTHDALITFANHTGSIRITNIDVFGIENFQFADGTIWTLSQLEQDYLSKQSTAGKDTLFGSINNDSINGLAGNDVIKGLEGDDTITGGIGDDILSGGNNNDTYVYNSGDGNDLIYDSFDGANKLIFGSGITTAEIRLTRDNTNVHDGLITFASRSGSIRITNMDGNFGSFQFADGTVWTLSQLEQDYLSKQITTGKDTLFGSSGNDSITGLAGNDVIKGNAGNDTITGSVGDDMLSGGDGNDTYIYNVGDGNDFIYDGLNGTDKIVFGSGITTVEIRLTRDSTNLNDGLITFANNSGSIRITNMDYFGIENFQFADGTVWTLATMLTKASANNLIQGTSANNILNGTVGNDSIYAGAGNDTITGGTGNDRMEGDDGDDIYRINLGDGRDVIKDDSYITGDKVIFGTGILPSAVQVAVDVNNPDKIIFTIDSNNSLIVENFVGYQNTINTFQFADGTVWTRADVMSRILTVAASTNDVLFGSYLGENISGGGGNDNIYAGAGNDNITGSTGNDRMEGGEGDDIYRINLGDGRDVIKDNSYITGDKVIFGTGILPSAVQVAVDVNNPDKIIFTIDSNNSLIVENFVNYQNTINTFQFADGTVWTRADVMNKILTAAASTNDVLFGSYLNDNILGGTGNDSIYGGYGNDTITGGTGNDRMNDEYGDDTYLVNLGDGRDIIRDNSYINGDKVIFGTGILPSAVQVSVDVNNPNQVIFTIDANNSLIVENFVSFQSTINKFQFADGTVWTKADVMNKILTAAASTNDILYGSELNDNILGGGGNDSIYGGFGNDTIAGGTGNDRMNDEYGDDTYLINLGDGRDIIKDNSYITGDKVIFGTGILPSAIQVAVDVNNPEQVIFTIDANNSLIVENFVNYQNTINTFQFADGTVWTKADVLRLIGNNDPLNYKPSATAGDDVLTGTQNNDTLEGASGNDALRGGGGADTYIYNLGDGRDSIYDAGGVGTTDKIVFGSGIKSSDVAVSTSTSDARDMVLTIGQDGSSIYLDGQLAGGGIGIERIEFADGTVWLASGTGLITANVVASAGAESIIGTSGNDNIRGGTGNDILRGNDGADTYTYQTGDGSDIILDSGVDGAVDKLVLTAINPSNITVGVDRNTSSMIINIGTQSIQLRNQIDGSGQGIEQVVFGNGVIWNGKDLEIAHLSGKSTAGNNTIEGFLGNDVINGLAGNDTLIGGAGADTYLFSLNQGDDVIHEQGYVSDIDQITFGTGITAANIVVSNSEAIQADLVLSFNNGAGRITLKDQLSGSGAGIEKVLFSDGTVWTASNILNAYFTRLATIGADTINGLIINDTIRGNDGNDTINGNAGDDVIYGDNGNDSLNGDFGNDTLYGGAGTDTLDGFTGNDTLYGEAGNDALTGGTGDDVLIGGAGADTINGSDGVDTASYTTSAAGVTVNLNLATAQLGSGDALGDILSKIENIIGSAFNDTLTALAAGSTINGGVGNDVINGGVGNDTLNGGTGADTINGGAGSDTVSYAGSASLVNVSLARTTGQFGGDAQGDILSNIENIIGSDSNDILAGNAIANMINGGTGTDTMSYAASNAGVTVNLGLSTAQASVGHASGDILSNIENLTGSAFADTLTGNAANNTIVGGAGADVINGGADFDWVSYATSSAGVNVNLGLTTAHSGGDAAGDTLINIENILGSNLNDTLTGNDIANILRGLSGKDTLTGKAGADVFKYSATTDSGTTSTTRDLITDFVGGTDKIDLADFTGTFAFKGTGAFVGGGGAQVNYAQSAGNTLIGIDADGNGILDMQIELSGLHGLAASDFLL